MSGPKSSRFSFRDVATAQALVSSQRSKGRLIRRGPTTSPSVPSSSFNRGAGLLRQFRWRCMHLEAITRRANGSTTSGTSRTRRSSCTGCPKAWSLALEGYGTVERLESTGHPSEPAQLFGDFDQHRAGAVLYYSYDFGGSRRSEAMTPGSALLTDTGEEEEGRSMTVGLGLLEGLNEDTPDHTLKLSIEVHF